jgi:hypothetical protein
VSAPDSATYTEAMEQDEPRHVGLAHLSIEAGHFFMTDLVDQKGGIRENLIREQFSRVAPWVRAARAGAVEEFGPKPRVSTCFLVDDYFGGDRSSPIRLTTKLTEIAGECGITFDYIAREAGCWMSAGVPLAELTAAMLLPEPPVGSNGSRPPLHESGWLCNGERSSDQESGQAMQVQPWRPPVEFGKRMHSIFVDMELWRLTEKMEPDGRQVSERIWSCPFLASVWHLVRLGMLRYYGEPVVQPEIMSDIDDWPDSWTDLPAVIQLNPGAAPFAAYRSVSVLPHYYQAIETAVDVVLRHLDLDKAVIKQVVERGRAEGIAVPEEVTHRMVHVFVQDVEHQPYL